MFNRKSQTILSEHYTKLIDHEDAPSGESTEDFITIKRRDHTLEGESLPESSYLSKRKLKMGQSKKAMLSHHGNPTKLVFDEEGASHPIYELAGEDDFKNDGDAKEQQQTFVEAEREILRIADLEDKERAKQKRREKKRKIKGDYEVRYFARLTVSPMLTLAIRRATTPKWTRWTTMATSRPSSTSPTDPTTTEKLSTNRTSRRRRSSVAQRSRRWKQSSIWRRWRCERWGSDKQLAIIRFRSSHQSSSSAFGFSLSAMYFSSA